MARPKTSDAGGDAAKATTGKQRRVGRPAVISREKLVETMIEVGVQSRQLKPVADKLGVTTPALYRHVNALDDLVEMATDELLKRYPIPEDGGEEWAEWAFELALVLREFFMAFPGLAEYTIGRSPLHPEVMRRHKLSVDIAIRSGFTPLKALWALRALTNFVLVSVTASERLAQFRSEAGQSREEAQLALLGAVPPDDEYATLKATFDESAGHEELEVFKFQARCLIDGLVAHRGEDT
ncbi:MAG: TetR/AcrR family transcriptional regulator C-terminal domain-containing protein [Pseudomonadota bacterium]|nr:TetR/AcrR family transcriptional regulator C-terminal domain-containing protein [Pseudomonadota bacterium]